MQMTTYQNTNVYTWKASIKKINLPITTIVWLDPQATALTLRSRSELLNLSTNPSRHETSPTSPWQCCPNSPHPQQRNWPLRPLVVSWSDSLLSAPLDSPILPALHFAAGKYRYNPPYVGMADITATAGQYSTFPWLSHRFCNPEK